MIRGFVRASAMALLIGSAVQTAWADPPEQPGLGGAEIVAVESEIDPAGPAAKPAGAEPAAAEPAEGVKVEPPAGVKAPMLPPDLAPDTHDLLKMKTGEWLVGTLQKIEDGTISFDSEEFDEITVDLADTAEIRSARPHTYRFEGRIVVTGPAVMEGDVIRIQTAQGMVEHPVSALVTMMEGEPTEWNFWSGELSLGLAMRRGNTNQSDMSLFGRLMRETVLTRFDNTYNGAFSAADTATPGVTTQTANNHRYVTGFDYFVTRRLFLTVATLEVYSDPFQNIALRVTPAAGLGYDVMSRRRFSWEVKAAVGYQWSKLSDPVATVPSESQDFAMLFGTVIELDPAADVEWDTTYSVQIIPTNMDSTNQFLQSVLSVELFGPVDLDATFVWNWINNPQPKADPTAPIPVSSDFRLSLGFGVDF